MRMHAGNNLENQRAKRMKKTRLYLQFHIYDALQFFFSGWTV